MYKLLLLIPIFSFAQLPNNWDVTDTLSEMNKSWSVGNGCEEDVFVVAENGYGKRSSIEDYRVTNRGGKGVKTINITEKTGALVALKSVTDNDDLMIITESGMTIRMAVNSVRVMGRAAQGVRLINLKDNDKIASVTRISASEDDEEIIEDVDIDIVESNDQENNNTED